MFSLFWVVWMVCSPPYIVEPVIKGTVEGNYQSGRGMGGGRRG